MTTEVTKDGRFEISRIETSADMAGRIEPFEPCWNVQRLSDGEQEFFQTKKECEQWIREQKVN